MLDGLYGANKFDVPKALIEEQIQQLQLDMARRANITDPKQLPPASTFEESARRRVALGLILGEIVKNESLKVDRERVQTRLNDVAAAYPNLDEVRRAYLQNADAMRQIESAVLEDQVVDWVVGQAKITDKPAITTAVARAAPNDRTDLLVDLSDVCDAQSSAPCHTFSNRGTVV